MRRLVSVLACLWITGLFGVPHCQAQPVEVAPVTVETPPSTWLTKTRAVIEALDPSPEMGVFVRFKDLGDGNLSQAEGFLGLSGSLYKFTSHDIELGSVRIGGRFEGDRLLYTTLGVNGIGLAKRYLSDDLKATLSPGFVATVWDTLDKYGQVSAGVGLSSVQDLFADGYTLDDHAGLIGTVGIRIPL